jgi:hypothetical protein
MPPANDHNRSVRPITGYDRTDHAIPPERSAEQMVSVVVQTRSPRPICAIDRSDRFFYGPANGGRGATGFFGGRVDRLLSFGVIR